MVEQREETTSARPTTGRPAEWIDVADLVRDGAAGGLAKFTKMAPFYGTLVNLRANRGENDQPVAGNHHAGRGSVFADLGVLR